MSGKLSDLKFVVAGPEHVKRLAIMVSEFEHYLSGLDRKHPRHSKRFIVSGLRRAFAGPTPLCKAIIVEKDGRDLGYALFNLALNTTVIQPQLYVHDFFVREGSRGQGIGPALLRALKKSARQHGCGVIELTVWNLNPKALGFYLEQGGKPVNDEIIIEWKVR